ncbi:MAG TPA: small ribosomal subunit Rsm22 family protein [Parachlamydiaceae bacterium]|nr:small ribosomal subunit Rsm22 family protein [Parachlamydiaceae bacterium]
MKSKRISLDLDTLMPLLISIWRRFQKEGGPSDKLQTREFRSVVEAVKKLQDTTQLGANYFKDKNLLGAYFLYQFVLHYQQGVSLIGELPFVPKRVLDICTGPGAFALAALKHGAEEVFATDQNKEALHLAAEVCGRFGFPLTTREWDCLKKPLPIDKKFDLITLGYSLNELFPPNKKGWAEEQQAFIEMLLDKLTDDGFLAIIESSFQEDNRRLLELRDRLVKKQVPVQAPCVWKGECPALKTPNSPCYAQRTFEKPYLIKEIQRAAEINLSSLKFSYIIFRNPKSGWPKLPEGEFYRIISPPIEIQGRKRFYLCGTDGKKILESGLKNHPLESKAFDYLRRGELISVQNANQHLNTFSVNENTKLKIVAACGKPIPENYE